MKIKKFNDDWNKVNENDSNDLLQKSLVEAGDIVVEMVSELFRNGDVDDLYDDKISSLFDKASDHLESRVWDDENWFNQDPAMSNNEQNPMVQIDNMGRPLDDLGRIIDEDSSSYDH